MVPEAIPTEVALCKLMSLDHVAHGAFQDEDSAGDEGIEGVGNRHGFGLLATGYARYFDTPAACSLEPAAGFIPLAINTMNGSPVFRAPTCTRTCSRPASRSRRSSPVSVNPRCS